MSKRPTLEPGFEPERYLDPAGDRFLRMEELEGGPDRRKLQQRAIRAQEYRSQENASCDKGFATRRNDLDRNTGHFG